jgi:hypothetical protein
VAALQVSVPLQALPSSQTGQVRVIAAVPSPCDVRVLSQVPFVTASCWMFAGVPSLPTSATNTLKENVQPAVLAKLYGGANENLMSNGSPAFTSGKDGQFAVARLPAYWMAGGAPGLAPGSGVQTPPATLVHDGKKSARANVWLSAAPASWLGPLVTVRLILTV